MTYSVDQTTIKPNTTTMEVTDAIDERLHQASALLNVMRNDHVINAYSDEIMSDALWGINSLIDDAIRFHRFTPKSEKSEAAS
jgi:hypothetical protein